MPENNYTKDKSTCEHEKFMSSINIFRLQESEENPIITGFSADIKIKCSECGQPFEFIGVPCGLTKSEPRANIDFTELHIPIRPSLDKTLMERTDEELGIVKQNDLNTN